MADVPIATRCAIYARVSLDQTGEGLAVERQQDACRKLAEARGWEVVESYVDNSVSAFSGRRRPGFEALKSRIQGGSLDAVVVWHIDRLTRSLIDLEDVIKLAEANGVTIATVTGDFDLGTDTGRMVARILASVARGEVERKSVRQRAANEQAAKAGKRRGGRRPFGYEDDGITVRDTEAAAVRAAFRDVLAGVTIGEIVRAWNAAGFKSGQGTAWRRDSVRVVLSNPRYAGLRAYLGEVVSDAEWPALIDETTYRAVQAVLSDPSRRRAPNAGRALLSGLALCGVCADGTTVHSGGGRPGYRVIRCKAANHLNRAAAPVEEYVGLYMCERLSRPDAQQLLQRKGPTVDAEALHAESLALRGRLDQLAVEFADGSLTASQLRAASERLQDRLAEVENQLADAGRVDMLGDLVGAVDVEAVWRDLPIGRRREVIAKLCTVTIHPPGRGTRTFRPETVSIEWRG